ncbi:hypothetical protein ACEPAI_3901 [Sanghuangporus weigelae]
MDPLQALQAAYSMPADSQEQEELLSTLRENLEANPSYIPVLCSSLVRGLLGVQDSLLRRWTLDLLHYGLSKSNLPVEKRTELATQSLDVLAGLLRDPNSAIVKTTVQCFGTVYPLLFRHLCLNRNLRPMWETLVACKARILEMVWAPTTSTGLKLVALKFMQRVILVQTRGVSDPRLQKPNDPNLSFCPADHPFINAAQLEAEGQKLMESVITIFYTMPNPDMMAAVVNSWGSLAKQRPNLAHIIISALASWNPGAIYHFPAAQVRSVEKAVRILLIHFSRIPQLHTTYAHQINESLSQQAIRMEQAAINERNRKAAAAAEASRKRTISALSDEASEAKRLKTEHDPSSNVASILANFDFSALPHTIVTDLIVSNLQILTESSLTAAVQKYRQQNGLRLPTAASQTPPLTDAEISQFPPEKPVVKAEPIDPLAMDMGDEEVDYEPDRLNEEISEKVGLQPDIAEGVEPIDIDEALRFAEFRLPPPREISEPEQRALVRQSMSRIWETSREFMTSSEAAASSHQPSHGALTQDLWMLLLVRMITRVNPEDEESKTEGDNAENERRESMEVDKAPRRERIRQVLFDYILTDFPSREWLAVTWMNEEWYNDKIKSSREPDWYPIYPLWVQKLVNAYEPMIDAKDRTLSKFLLDIPFIPQEVLNLLRDLCVEHDRMQVGFITLREFVIQRVPLRAQAMKTLLDLTTHSDKVTRGAAIITVKRWVPDVQPMGDMVRIFALRLLRRLQKQPAGGAQANGRSKSEDGHDDSMEDGEMPQEEMIQTEFLPERVELPAQTAQVLQHVELIFALCVKCPEFLNEIFDAYGQMDTSVQEAIQDLITALIRSLGPNHGKLLSLMRTFPPGAESLALRVLNIFTENNRPTAPLVSLVKSLATERDLDPRFLIPIIAEMDKADIIKHLPRVVSMLNGTAEVKQLVKSVFESIVTTPPQTFGSVTSNLPRVRQSELLTPAELMVLLHEAEKEIGLKSTIEAIGICFSMTDVFRSEILAVVMQQIVDEPVLPVLFLRTVIQAVTTYKSLVGFVSTTLLSRLITKKIWTNPPLWEGFIRCAKTIAPASFGALLQLPKDQLRELVDKQPGLKAGLREFVLKKAGNKARQAGFLDLFGDDRSQSPAPQPQAEPVPAAPSFLLVRSMSVEKKEGHEGSAQRRSDSIRSGRRRSRRPSATRENDRESSSEERASAGSWNVDRGRSRTRRPSNPASEDNLRRRGYHALFSSFGKVFHVEKRWKMIRDMGSGAYGVVISAADEISGETVAIKLVTRVFEKTSLAKRALREITLLRHFANHENITGLIDVDAISKDFNEIYLFLEPMEADLHQIIKSGQALTNEHVQYFVYQILRGMKYVHSASVVHRDLKPGNLLVNADCELKICDFGLARGFNSRPDEFATHMTEYVATRWYRAPEIMLAFRRYNQAIDQLNKILDVLGTPDESMLKRIGSEKAQAYVRSLPCRKTVPFSKLMPNADSQAIDLLAKMLAFDPDQRITVTQALEHPWLASYHDVNDEPECPTPYNKWHDIEKLETIEDFREALWNEIQEYRKEVRSIAVDYSSRSPATSEAERRLVGATAAESSAIKEEEQPEEVPGTETGSTTAVEGAADKDTFVEVPSKDAQEKTDSATATINANTTIDPSPVTAPPSFIRPGLDRRDSMRPPTPANMVNDPVVHYARRSSILADRYSYTGSVRFSKPSASPARGIPGRSEEGLPEPAPPSATSGLSGLPAGQQQGGIPFPSFGPTFIVPARSRTASTTGGDYTYASRRLLRTLSTVSIHESVDGANGLAAMGPIGQAIMERRETAADAPPSEMPRDFGTVREEDEHRTASGQSSARITVKCTRHRLLPPL